MTRHPHEDTTQEEYEEWLRDNPEPAPTTPLVSAETAARHINLSIALANIVAIGQCWLVWSNEHSAWWGPSHRGYYIEVASAGRYTLDDALRICKSRSSKDDGNPDELVQPSPELLSMIEEFKKK